MVMSDALVDISSNVQDVRSDVIELNTDFDDVKEDLRQLKRELKEFLLAHSIPAGNSGAVMGGNVIVAHDEDGARGARPVLDGGGVSSGNSFADQGGRHLCGSTVDSNNIAELNSYDHLMLALLVLIALDRLGFYLRFLYHFCCDGGNHHRRGGQANRSSSRHRRRTESTTSSGTTSTVGGSRRRIGGSRGSNTSCDENPSHANDIGRNQQAEGLGLLPRLAHTILGSNSSRQQQTPLDQRRRRRRNHHQRRRDVNISPPTTSILSAGTRGTRASRSAPPAAVSFAAGNTNATATSEGRSRGQTSAPTPTYRAQTTNPFAATMRTSIGSRGRPRSRVEETVLQMESGFHSGMTSSTPALRAPPGNTVLDNNDDGNTIANGGNNNSGGYSFYRTTEEEAADANTIGRSARDVLWGNVIGLGARAARGGGEQDLGARSRHPLLQVGGNDDDGEEEEEGDQEEEDRQRARTGHQAMAAMVAPRREEEEEGNMELKEFY